jgi:MFS family permease
MWPSELGVHIEAGGSRGDVWKFGAVNAIVWFSAAVLGPLLVDPICYSRLFGRRGSVFLAAMFSLASSIGGSRATSWKRYLVARLLLGIGIGAKASIVPIWESEILPPNKRGRILVSWQVFTAIGIFAGSVATYIFRDSWRNQVLSGAIPALILLIVTYLGCESPRWLIIQGKYVKAFDTLVRLRKERRLAAEEFVYIYYQIQTERYYQMPTKKSKDKNKNKTKQKPDLNHVRNAQVHVASPVSMLSLDFS